MIPRKSFFLPLNSNMFEGNLTYKLNFITDQSLSFSFKEADAENENFQNNI